MQLAVRTCGTFFYETLSVLVEYFRNTCLELLNSLYELHHAAYK